MPNSALDLVLVVDDSPGMADKQALLADALPRLLDSLAHPRCLWIEGSAPLTPVQPPVDAGLPCPEGALREHAPLTDVHVAVVSSSLGGHGSDACPGKDRQGRRLGTTTLSEEDGCGYEAPLEAWYRFLVDPDPPAKISASPDPLMPPLLEGTDEILLAQRREFLRPSSAVMIVNLSDENDCSLIDGVLPKDVCEDPEFDGNGHPVGCKIDRRGWPAGYVEGNFEGWSSTVGRTTGTPFSGNHLLLQQQLQGAPFHLHAGTAACKEDPYDPSCRSCYLGGDGCAPLDDASDPPSLRCWDQKRRFGVDALYPLKRYVDGLTQSKVYDRNGFLVPNPLFDDLTFLQARKDGIALDRPRAENRSSLLVFYGAIVGVPWQDIAHDPEDLTRGYKPAIATQEGETGIDWDLILGTPFAVDRNKRKGPEDPLMVESIVPRLGTHPITGEAIGLAGWNRIHGHERETGGQDLQYACVFDLPAPRDCSGEVPSAACPCATDASAAKTPLCDEPPGGGSPTVQRRAGAYPGTRFLQVAKDFGQNAIVASICPASTDDPSGEDFALVPAARALQLRLRSQLSSGFLFASCLEKPLPKTPEGAADLLVLEGRFRVEETPEAAPWVADCNRCDRPGLRPLSPEVERQVRTLDFAPKGLTSGAAVATPLNPSWYACLCELVPLEGPALEACQTSPSDQDLGVTGWCPLDTEAPSEAQRARAEELLSRCPEGQRQGGVRFTGLSAGAPFPSRAQLFILDMD